MQLQQYIYKIFYWIFPTTCLHCHKRAERFERLLCPECLNCAITDGGKWRGKVWIVFDPESPLQSLWKFGKEKKFVKPLRALAAMCAAHWSLSNRSLPRKIFWVASKPHIFSKFCAAEQFALELARFFQVECYHGGAQDFEENTLVVFEKTTRLMHVEMEELKLQKHWLLQLPS